MKKILFSISIFLFLIFISGCDLSTSLVVTHKCEYEYTETVESTCLEAGYELYSCKICKWSYKVYFEKDKHNIYKKEVVKKPTFTEEGFALIYCHNNNHVVEVTLPVLNKEDYSVYIDSYPTCTEHGVTTYVYEYEKVSFAIRIETEPLGHTLEEKISYSKETHFYRCEVCSQSFDEEEHTFIDGVCECGFEEEMIDVINNLQMDLKTEYIHGDFVTGYFVSVLDTDDTVIEIPDEFNGYKIVALNYNAFDKASNLEVLILPNTLLKIYDYTYKSDKEIKVYYNGSLVEWFNIICDGSKPLYGVKEFYYVPEDEYVLLKDLEIPVIVDTVQTHMSGYLGLESIVFNHVPGMKKYAFADCSNVTYLELPETPWTLSIPSYAFAGLSKVTSIRLPWAISIQENAFAGSGITTIYSDTEEDLYQHFPNLENVYPYEQWVSR